MAQELIVLQPRMQVERWTIEKKLGEYALKVEGVAEQIQVLKMEVYVLAEFTKRGSRHFCKIEDKRRYGSFNYVVMTLVRKSLQDLNKGGPGGHMTLGSLEDLHNIGYLHRDVKPGNYTIGRAELNKLRKVYVLDFGMCRKFTNDQDVIRKPNQAAGFRGTVRYAPISGHLQRELCRKDDCETWVYMIVEFTYGRVPWKEVQDMIQVGEYKKRVRQPTYIMELFPPPGNFQTSDHSKILFKAIHYDAPNYQMIYGLVRQALQSSHVHDYPYDWEMGGPTAYLLH
ncbi:unnamed protein product [Heligmosomoides polygyrus]|uniref:non-specific serine/threonine protein kinase n=1 Tax=Heligmosomoides polygyrus TaxID=6339 RepID=A0A183FAC4_HELPZ|nr:unnamed protein product [Heligmosomoides polygyrus]